MSGRPSLKYLLFLLAGLVLMTAGCMNRATAKIAAGTNLSEIKSVHVVKSLPDGRGIDQMIANRLGAMGYSATTGDVTPSGVDAIVTYEDRWKWDMSLYMVQLTIFLRDKDSGFPLATANSMHGSLTRKSPEEMIAEVLGSLLGGGDVGGKSR